MSRRAWVPRVGSLLIPFGNLALALVVTAIVLWLIGVPPLAALGEMAAGAFGNADGIAYTLYYTTTYICTGLAVAIPYAAGLFNIGGEGQAAMGGLGVALVCLRGGALPWWLTAIFAIVAAAGAGAGWALVPAVLQIRRGSHIVITTIMFNFIASALMTWLLVDVLRAPGDSTPETVTFADATFLPSFGDTPLNLSFVLALALVGAAWLFVRRTVPGYELRAVGLGPEAAAYAAIPVGRVALGAMLIGGACAGLVGVNEIMGVLHRLVLGFTAGAGFIGIAVALMARGHPLAILPAALLFGALAQGGSELSFDYPAVTRDIVVLVDGLVILFCGALEGVLRRRLPLRAVP